MKIDFHFYLVYALARWAGFEGVNANGEKEAQIIAYASQYVDDNDEAQVIDTAGHEPEALEVLPEASASLIKEVSRCQRFPWAVRIKETGNFFRPIMTQTGSFNSLIPIFQRYLFVPFHFLPGDLEEIPQIRGRRNPWSTTANSRNGIALLKEALDSGDLYRIGAALHTFADTWSHQNFSGLRDDWNAVQGSVLVPDVGHAEVFEKPDRISEIWEDKRVNKQIVNADRARAAAREIFNWLSMYHRSETTWEDVKDEFEELLLAEDEDRRREMVKGMYPDEDLAYDRNRWIDGALEYDPDLEEVVAKPGFWSSHWYKFQCAVQKHLATVVPLFPEAI